jgi:gamma-glutamylcyclotransferase (GGCT)/AIG2-like uncharacterized protein YtfP
MEIWIWIQHVRKRKSHKLRSVENMKQKKNLEIFDNTAGILKGYKLIFTKGIPFIEPGFASILKGTENDQVHGTLALISKETAITLDAQESGYNIEKVSVQTYGNEVIEAEIYAGKTDTPTLGIPSLRYLRLLIKGAEESNLNEDYIEKLKNHEYYVPSKETLEKREKLPKKENLKHFTIEELSEYNGKDGKLKCTCALGYVVKVSGFVFPSWIGRDVTNRNLLHFRGFSVDKLDDGGKTFPKLSTLTSEEHEYLKQNLDAFIQEEDSVVGILKEFWEAQ